MQGDVGVGKRETYFTCLILFLQVFPDLFYSPLQRRYDDNIQYLCLLLGCQLNEHLENFDPFLVLAPDSVGEILNKQIDADKNRKKVSY